MPTTKAEVEIKHIQKNKIYHMDQNLTLLVIFCLIKKETNLLQ